MISTNDDNFIVNIWTIIFLAYLIFDFTLIKLETDKIFHHTVFTVG